MGEISDNIDRTLGLMTDCIGLIEDIEPMLGGRDRARAMEIRKELRTARAMLAMMNSPGHIKEDRP